MDRVLGRPSQATTVLSFTKFYSICLMQNKNNDINKRKTSAKQTTDSKFLTIWYLYLNEPYNLYFILLYYKRSTLFFINIDNIIQQHDSTVSVQEHNNNVQ